MRETPKRSKVSTGPRPQSSSSTPASAPVTRPSSSLCQKPFTTPKTNPNRVSIGKVSPSISKLFGEPTPKRDNFVFPMPRASAPKSTIQESPFKQLTDKQMLRLQNNQNQLYEVLENQMDIEIFKKQRELVEINDEIKIAKRLLKKRSKKSRGKYFSCRSA